MEKDIITIRSFVKEAIRLYCQNPPKDIEQKAAYDLVTEIDKKIEAFIIEKIKSIYPGDNILSEESRSSEQIHGRTWTIDPIDGTLNMVHGIKIFGVQISLFDETQGLLSYIYFPKLKDEYSAYYGGGAFHNGKKVTVKSVELENSIISLGDFSHSNKQNALRQYHAMERLYKIFGRLRMVGSAAMDFSFVGSGCTQACIVITKNLWDILPGFIFAKEAGAILTDLDGNEFHFGDNGLVAAADSSILKEIIKALKV